MWRTAAAAFAVACALPLALSAGPAGAVATFETGTVSLDAGLEFLEDGFTGAHQGAVADTLSFGSGSSLSTTDVEATDDVTVATDPDGFLTQVSIVATASVSGRQGSQGQSAGDSASSVVFVTFDVATDTVLQLSGSVAGAGSASGAVASQPGAMAMVQVQRSGDPALVTRQALGGPGFPTGTPSILLGDTVRLTAGTWVLNVTVNAGGELGSGAGSLAATGAADVDAVLIDCDNTFTDGPDEEFGTPGTTCCAAAAGTTPSSASVATTGCTAAGAGTRCSAVPATTASTPVPTTTGRCPGGWGGTC